MSDTKHSETIFTNEQTLRRRAWIERALNGVKGKSRIHEERIEPVEDAGRPRLRVVNSDRSR